MEATSVKEQFAGFRHGGKVHFRRFPVQLPIAVKLEGGQVQHQCESSNVSPRGIYFDFPVPVDVGSRLEILLTIPEQVTKGEPILVRLFGTAVRVDRGLSRNGPVGIAATIERYDFVEESPAQPVSREEDLSDDERANALCFRVNLRDPAADPQKVDQLFAALRKAKQTFGENTDNMSPDTFKRFVHRKTAHLKRKFGCQQVEYLIEVDRGQVKLKAKVV